MGQIVRNGEDVSSRARVRVLIADDDRGVRRVLRQWLERHGSFQVTEEAADGLEAISAARRGRPELAILDLAMPGVDGLKAASEIRQLLPHTRIVVRSGLSAARMAEKAIDAGADVYLEKHLAGAQFLAVLEELFPGSQPAPPPAPQGGAPESTALPEAAELLEATVISSPVGAALFDRSARLVIANPVADRLLGGTALFGASPPTRNLRYVETGQPIKEEDLPVRDACLGRPFDDVELFVVGDEDAGSGTYVRVSGRPISRPQGEPGGAVISVLDDTAAKRTLRELAATQEELKRSNAELENFASTASHELSQPLHKIYAFAQLLRERGFRDERADDFIDRVVAGCEQMRTLIHDLLAYSMITTEARVFEPVELAGVVEEVLQLFQQDVASSAARVTVTTVLPTVLADRTQMSQLFQNLIGNALRYGERGVAPIIEIGSAPGEQGWQIHVTDNGIGISPADRERAFAMFQRLVSSDDYAGTGIGLAVCARILERHGGRIWIEDSASGGTTVVFTIADAPPRTTTGQLKAPEAG